MVEKLSYDLVIVGGGAAGLRAAIAAADLNNKLSIAVLSKVYPMRSHTVSAEGGTGAVLREDDNFDLHAWDTIKGSDFLADQDIVEYFVGEAPNEIIRLEHWGCPWNRDADGKMSVRAFGGMSVKRTVFAADKTGFHLLHTLFQRTMKYENIVRHDEWFVVSLLTEKSRVFGLIALELKTGKLNLVMAKAVILATGGAGKIYEFTTNGYIKTGDGMALAYRAGAAPEDMEFVQYHPTCLPGTGILITEAARGEGGYMVNKEGERFLRRYIPGKMELGPRDILSRAIVTEIMDGKGLEGPYGIHVLLDLRHLGEDVIDTRLPFVRELSKNYSGIDPVKEPIPIRPGVHYFMGGIHADINGSTGVNGLFAAGEAACLSLNGANRLGSNSLSECLVFGARTGRAAAEFAARHESYNSLNPTSQYVALEEKRIFDEILKKEAGKERISVIRKEMQHTMESEVGIYREEKGLKEALIKIRELKNRFKEITVSDRESVFNTELLAILELDMMLELSSLIAESALLRTESRGAHYRLDYANRNDQKFLSHILFYQTLDGPRPEALPVTVTKWQPTERVY